jgi:hypothetical protein
MTASVAPFLASEFAAIDEYMKAVSAILADGHMPDLAGLDARVSEVCIAMESADSDTQQKFLPRMSELLKKLDLCEAEIRAFHDNQVKAHQA